MLSIPDVRAACASLPHSHETFPFGLTTLVFKVGGPGWSRMYALLGLDDDPPAVSLKVAPERGDELRAAYDAVSGAPHLNKRHWISVPLDGRVPDAVVRDLLAASHALVVRGLTRAQRAELGQRGANL
ncbi:putative DNA-binding protein (MmcQ/YjbR family) [Deinococcus metalli]|uniref:MmcQ-like protein n=1 Tax=Deinococcus metalli TaxID=1141878 RepID=A0A7W8NTH6_9DEIO|nr:MmcQ/YjbR family DNA-binding protein [Deinococcus metalli]MBB5378187.1 putative DNA-binding protein (MmcQ/YjbR family) [Deinococcus metalli]GHF56682.1 MmcQ-like protein [Deinococcus metalli]